MKKSLKEIQPSQMFVYKTLISEEPHGAILKGQCTSLKGEF